MDEFKLPPQHSAGTCAGKAEGCTSKPMIGHTMCDNCRRVYGGLNLDHRPYRGKREKWYTDRVRLPTN